MSRPSAVPSPKPADILSAITASCMAAYAAERTAQSEFATTLQYDDKKQERAARARAARRRVKLDGLLVAINLLQRHGPEFEAAIATMLVVPPREGPKRSG